MHGSTLFAAMVLALAALSGGASPEHRAAEPSQAVNAQPAAAASAADPLLAALRTELERSFKALSHAEATPLYYLAYEVTHKAGHRVRASWGALETDSRFERRDLDVDARVGSPELDNTHEVKGRGFSTRPQYVGSVDLPLEDDPAAIRAEVWLQTDRAYKNALEAHTTVKTNRAVTATVSRTCRPTSRFTTTSNDR